MILGEHVSLAADGEDDTGLSGVVAEFFTEASDVHVDGPGIDAAGFEFPDAGEDFFAGDGSSAIAREVGEEFDFPLGKLGAGTIGEAELGASEVDGGILDADAGDIAGSFRGASEDGIDTSEEFLDAEGFDDVVVGAGAQAVDAILFFAFGGEDDDGEGWVSGTEFLEDVHAEHSREDQVQEDEIAVGGESGGESGVSVGGFCGKEAMEGEGIDDTLSDGVVVFDYEDTSAGHNGIILEALSENGGLAGAFSGRACHEVYCRIGRIVCKGIVT